MIRKTIKNEVIIRRQKVKNILLLKRGKNLILRRQKKNTQHHAAVKDLVLKVIRRRNLHQAGKAAVLQEVQEAVVAAEVEKAEDNGGNHAKIISYIIITRFCKCAKF